MHIVKNKAWENQLTKLLKNKESHNTLRGNWWTEKNAKQTANGALKKCQKRGADDAAYRIRMAAHSS